MVDDVHMSNRFGVLLLRLVENLKITAAASTKAGDYVHQYAIEPTKDDATRPHAPDNRANWHSTASLSSAKQSIDISVPTPETHDGFGRTEGVNALASSDFLGWNSDQLVAQFDPWLDVGLLDNNSSSWVADQDMFNMLGPLLNPE